MINNFLRYCQTAGKLVTEESFFTTISDRRFDHHKSRRMVSFFMMSEEIIPHGKPFSVYNLQTMENSINSLEQGNKRCFHFCS